MYSEQKNNIDLAQEAIASNRDALLGIVAWLFSVLELTEGGSLPRMPLPLYRALLKVLVPAESALRRLIVLAAQGVVVALKPAAASRPSSPPKRGGTTGKGRVSPPLFQLIDPEQRSTRRRPRRPPQAEPRIRAIDFDPRICALPEWQPKPKPKPEPDGLIDPKRLCRRLDALKRALTDIPRQAKRLARWRARQAAKQPPQTTSPLRDGHPPGHRKRWQHEVDDILAECHDLALQALRPDTS